MDVAQQVAKMVEKVSKICINQAELTRSMQVSQQEKDIGRQNPNVQCYNCFERGHISPNCSHPNREGGGIAPTPRRVEEKRSQNQVNSHGINLIDFKNNDNVKDALNTTCGKVMLDGDSYYVLVGKRARVEKHEQGSRMRSR